MNTPIAKHRIIIAILATVSAIIPTFLIDTSTAEAASEEAPLRTVFQEDFSNDIQWIQSKPYISNGVAHITGSGPDNRIETKSVILASTFDLNFDLWIGTNNTNSNIKFGFFADNSTTTRYQVNYSQINQYIQIEKLTNGTSTVLASKRSFQLPINNSQAAHKINISVDSAQIELRINNNIILSANDAQLSDATSGKLVFSSQFPAQDWTIDNILVQTSEPEIKGQYTVTLQTRTNGNLDTDPQSAGGTLASNRQTGNNGDLLYLIPTAKEGFIFDGYESYATDTNLSTDGLMPIIDNSSNFTDKVGNVTIIAKFVNKPIDTNLIFQDTFSSEIDENSYTFFNRPQVSVTSGKMQLSPTTTLAPVWAQLNQEQITQLTDYRIETTLQFTSNPGTYQIAFRGSSFNDRYAVVINNSAVAIRHISNTANVRLANVAYKLGTQPIDVAVIQHSGTVSVTINGSPVIAYTNTENGNDKENWSNLQPMVSLVAMTPDAPMTVDQIAVKRIPKQINLSAQVMCNETIDADATCGAITLSKYSAYAGDTITWQTATKGDYIFDRLVTTNMQIDKNSQSLLIPTDATSDITVIASFKQQTASSRTIYFDSFNGNDANDGLSTQTPRRSLPTANERFNPGDNILIKRGSVYVGEAANLQFSGSGTSEKPITIASYGEGALPRLEGNGKITNVVQLTNQEHITISELEITNTLTSYNHDFSLNSSNNTKVVLRGVNITARDFGVVHGITVTNLHIHDINGNISNKWNGGIFVDIGASIENNQLKGRPTKYDQLLVESNLIERVDRSGMKFVNSPWCNQSLTNNPNVPINWYPSTNVIVRDNRLYYLGGDGITVRDTDGAHIEKNLVRHARYQQTGYNAGIWPFEATNTVVQYNEVSHTHGTMDGQGLDCNHASAHTVMQYNYSHNNEGGFMLIMNGYPHTAPTIRFNVSKNDNDKAFEFSQGMAPGTAIYNNTIISDRKLYGSYSAVFGLANSRIGGASDVFVWNNIFSFPQDQNWFTKEVDTLKQHLHLYNNVYIGVSAPDIETQSAQSDLEDIFGDMLLQSNDTSPQTIAISGITQPHEFTSITPDKNSRLATLGISLESAVAHFGGDLSNIINRSDMSPANLNELAKSGRSIDYIAADHMPHIPGVNYQTDFLGQPIHTDNSQPQFIGAIQPTLS